MSLLEFVLTPVDFSAASRAALDLSLAWSRGPAGHVTLLNAAYVPTIFQESMLIWSEGESSSLTDVARRGAEGALAELTAALGAADRERTQSRVVFGAPAESIVAEARQKEHTVIVMGTHDREGLSGVFGGSTTGKVLRQAPCPVVAVPPGAAALPPRTILAATDFSQSSGASLREAANLAKAFGASLDVLHVYSAPSFLPPNTLIGAGADNLEVLSKMSEHHATEELNRFVADLRKCAIDIRDGNVLFGSPARSIVEYTKRGQYDLLVLGTLGRSGVSHLVVGSVAESVVRYAPCPVLTVRHDYEPLREAA
jgi:nucleotide-binding universal stress UspA family protein